MHRGLTIALVLVVMILGAASAKLFFDPRGTADVPAPATTPAGDELGQSRRAADVGGQAAPDGARSASTPGSTAEPEGAKPASSAPGTVAEVAAAKPAPPSSRSVAVAPVPLANAVNRRPGAPQPGDTKPDATQSPPASPPPARPAPAQPVPVSPAPTPNRPAGETSRAASTSDDDGTLTAELRRELIRRYLEALGHLRD